MNDIVNLPKNRITMLLNPDWNSITTPKLGQKLFLVSTTNKKW